MTPTANKIGTFLLVLFCIRFGECFLNEKEVAIFNLKTASYNNQIFPPKKDGEPLRVKISMHVLHMSLDPSEHKTATWNVFFRMRWNDQRLKFNNSSIDTIHLHDSAALWVPDIFVVNALESARQDFIGPNSLVQIDYNGNVLLSNRLILTSPCSRKIWDFPHDLTSCPIQIESYGHQASEMLLIRSEDMVSFGPQNQSGIPPLGFVHNCFTFDGVHETSTGSYTAITVECQFKMEFKRSVPVLYIPIIMLVIISFLSQLMSVKQITQRLLMTLLPLLTMSTLCFFLRFITAMPMYEKTIFDTFSGVSVLTVFFVLVQVLVQFYRLEKSGEAGAEELEKPSKVEKLKEYQWLIGPLALPLFYALFLVIYFSVHN